MRIFDIIINKKLRCATKKELILVDNDFGVTLLSLPVNSTFKKIHMMKVRTQT